MLFELAREGTEFDDIASRNTIGNLGASLKGSFRWNLQWSKKDLLGLHD